MGGESLGITVVISHTKSLPNTLFELRVPVLQKKQKQKRCIFMSFLPLLSIAKHTHL